MANNHQGQLEHGRKIIQDLGKVAKDNGIRAAIKFQFRQMDTFIHPDHKKDSAWSQLVVFSFIIPNTAPDKDLSFKILRLFLTDTKARQLFQRPEFGYTSNELNGDDLTLFNSPEALRNLNFNLFNPNYTQFDEKLWR
jgi:glutathione synthase/RimK-type ligase-like ATP-grasp enzyme